jgi:hypothetical protein
MQAAQLWQRAGAFLRSNRRESIDPTITKQQQIKEQPLYGYAAHCAWLTSLHVPLLLAAVAAGEWLPKASATAGQQPLHSLTADTFHCSPAAAALAALIE